MSVSRQGKLLAFLLGLLAVSLSLNFAPRGNPVSGIVVPPPPPPSRMDSFPDPRLQTELLDRYDARPYGGVHRNVFDFGGGALDNPFASIDEEGTVSEQEQSGPSVPDLQYIGLYREKKEGGEMMAAVRNGGRIFVVHAGEMIENSYQVLEIEDDFIVTKTLSDGRVFRFSLGKEMPPEEVEEGQ